MKKSENNALEIVQLINEIVDKEYENIKGQGEILEGIEKLHQQIRFEEPYLAEYIKKRMLCLAEGKGKVNAAKIFFLCDGEVKTCKKHSCYKNGGDCKFTSDIGHAKNFQKFYKSSTNFYENDAASGNQTQSED